MSISSWSRREIRLLSTLAGKVCMLRAQDAKGLWNAWKDGGHPSFRRAVDRLIAAELLECYLVNLHPAMEPQKPLLRLIGNAELDHDLERAAKEAQARWCRPAQPTRVLVASRRTANLFGSTSKGLPTVLHRDHDALLGEVYVRYVTERPQLARWWVGEHVLPKGGFRVKDPDAFLYQNGRPYRIVESGGSYGVRQLASLVQHARERKLELEIW